MSKEKKVWCGSKPELCDICKQPIQDSFIDGKTIHGPWGIMCCDCHLKHGVGFGVGKGQQYKKEGETFAKIFG